MVDPPGPPPITRTSQVSSRSCSGLSGKRHLDFAMPRSMGGSVLPVGMQRYQLDRPISTRPRPPSSALQRSDQPGYSRVDGFPLPTSLLGRCQPASRDDAHRRRRRHGWSLRRSLRATASERNRVSLAPLSESGAYLRARPLQRTVRNRMARSRHRAGRIGFLAAAAAHDTRLRGMRSACAAAPLGWTIYWICRLLVSRTDPVIPVPVALLSAAVPLLCVLAWLSLSGKEEH